MATAGELALPAGAKGRLVHPRFARAPTIPASGSLRRNASSTAPLVRLPPPSRYAATRSSLAVVRVGRRHSLFGRGSSGAEAGAYQMRGGRGLPNATGNATGPGDGAPALDADEKVRVIKIMALFLRIHQEKIARQQLVAKLKNVAGTLLLLGICLWIGYLAVKGDEHAVLLVAVCDKGDKVYKIALAIKKMLLG